MQYLKSFLILFLFSLVLLTPIVTTAVGFVEDPLVPCGRAGQDACNLCHLWQMASNIINFLIFNISIPLATVLIIGAGILMLVSGGSQSRVRLAKSIFIHTIIGLVIVFTAWLTVDTILKTIATDEFRGAWKEFPVCQPSD